LGLGVGNSLWDKKRMANIRPAKVKEKRVKGKGNKGKRIGS
jgi:hypothetical protein